MNGLLGPGALYLFAIRALVTLIVIPFHESAHALVSWLLGDPTAKNAGRLSLNPLRHFDPVGTVCMLLGGVGWARPVGVQPYRFRNPKVGMAVSAAAGPMSNLLLAYICMILYKAAVYATNGAAAGVVLDFLWLMISMNTSLAVFNLLPVQPFDGSRIFLLFLPQRTYFRAMRYERVIMAVVLLLVLTGLLDRPLSFCVNAVWQGLDTGTLFVDALFRGL